MKLLAPLLTYNHFVEALFALNDCQVGVCRLALGGASAASGWLGAEGSRHFDVGVKLP